MPALSETVDFGALFAAHSAEFESAGGGVGPSWLRPLRQAALSRFRELGLPHRRMEEWRSTDVRAIAETPFRPAGDVSLTEAELSALPFSDVGAARLVFVNGRYRPELSRLAGLPDGVKVGSLADALANDPAALERHLGRHAQIEHAPFAALNTAFLSDGAFVSVPRGVVAEEPIHLLFVAHAGAEPVASHPRALVVVAENGAASVIETYVGTGRAATLTNAVTEVVLAENAVLDHVKVTHEAPDAFHVAAMQVTQARSSNFRSQNVTLGGLIVRNDHGAALNGEGAEATLNGLYLAGGRQLVDNHTSIDHASAHCPSHELYKGILDGRARGVFNGKIVVRQDAQKTDAKQTNQTLLLSKDAQIDTKPQLEIFADDVRCTHGATIGQLSAEALFYLRSRGIARDDARAILTFAFASEIVENIRVEKLREQVHAALLAALPRAGLAGA